ncbi:hypothetical protein HRG_008941 [Hirsutella rhossiliensis]|uniref:Uncharacterized protein n=1 Tax=Hirsutella rhossiliensis TaxID=111463 RepID=A0A9P8MRF9_9HYPO|nr:uncharacterized protein HRG_08941 [Hirsutella rhossiliensis]KAH0959920.1 hypothetical protein HRG_08941 [Hirsutella rhossiliensis]
MTGLEALGLACNIMQVLSFNMTDDSTLYWVLLLLLFFYVGTENFVRFCRRVRLVYRLAASFYRHGRIVIPPALDRRDDGAAGAAEPGLTLVIGALVTDIHDIKRELLQLRQALGLPADGADGWRGTGPRHDERLGLSTDLQSDTFAQAVPSKWNVNTS